ncbi:MAG: hypothetical protein FWH52_07425 [Synergistaceae bacterium]|nr:hypothetical protein [Synergistaceae bacterium]
MKKIIKTGICIYLFMGLFYSSAFGEVNVFEIVATRGVSEVRAVIGLLTDINEKDKSGMTVLMWAAWKNPNLDVIKFIVDAGGDVSMMDNSGNTALDYMKKDLNYNKLKSEYYKLLWKNNESLPKDSYFVELCGGGTASEVASAIQGGANVNAVDQHGVPPVFWAAWLNSDVGVISALLASGANPSVTYGGMTPLIMAASDNPNPEVIIALLKSGADPKAQDSSGNKAIDYAEGNRAVRGSNAYSMLWEATFEKLSSKRIPNS